MSQGIDDYQFKYEFKSLGKQLTIHFDEFSKFYCQQLLLSQNQYIAAHTQHYQFQTHRQFIKFRYVNDEVQFQNHQPLIQTLKHLFQYIRVVILHSTNLSCDNLFYNICKGINLSIFECYKLIIEEQKDLKKGDLVLYFNKSIQVQAYALIKKIKLFVQESLIFPMDQFILKINKQEINYMDVLQCCIQKFLPSIQKICADASLTLIDIEPNTNSAKINEKIRFKNSLKFKVQGECRKFIQFYFNIQKLFKQNSIQVIKINEILCCKVGQLAEYLKKNIHTAMINFETLAIFNQDNNGENSIMNKIKTGLWLLTNQFTKKQLYELKKNEDDYKNKLREQQIIHEGLQINDERIIVRCQTQQKIKLISLTKKFLQSRKNVQKICKQFDSSFLIKIFFMHYAQKIQQKFKIKFVKKQQKLYRINYQNQNGQIEHQLKLIKSQIYDKIVRFPTLIRIKESQLYDIIDKPKDCKLQNLTYIKYKTETNIQISLCSYESISSMHQHVIYLVDNNKETNSQFQKIMCENNLNYQNFFDNAANKKELRLTEYPTPSSRFIKNILGWYVNINDISYRRKIQTDVELMIEKLKQYSRVYFLIPHLKTDMPNQVITYLINYINHIKRTHIINISWKQLVFYYLRNDDKKNLERKLCNPKLKLIEKNRLYIPKNNLYKIINLDYYSFKYFKNDQTKALTSVNSFIFSHQRNKLSVKARVPIIISNAKITQQYLIDLINDQYYIIYYQKNFKFKFFKKIQTIQNKQIIQIAKIIHKYFKKLQYLVVPKTCSQNLIQNLQFYFVQNENIMNKMKLDLNNQKIIVLRGELQIPYNFSITNYLEWYVIQVYQTQLNNLRKLIFK